MEPINNGIKADAAIVMEGPSDRVVTLSNGLAKWDISINQWGMPCHQTDNRGRGNWGTRIRT